jgi:prephenate dehydratase
MYDLELLRQKQTIKNNMTRFVIIKNSFVSKWN